MNAAEHGILVGAQDTALQTAMRYSFLMEGEKSIQRINIHYADTTIEEIGWKKRVEILQGWIKTLPEK
jgi:hypothetical protein